MCICIFIFTYTQLYILGNLPPALPCVTYCYRGGLVQWVLPSPFDFFQHRRPSDVSGTPCKIKRLFTQQIDTKCWMRQIAIVTIQVKTRRYYNFSWVMVSSIELKPPTRAPHDFFGHQDSGSHDKFVELLLHNSTRMAPWQLGQIMSLLLISNMMCMFFHLNVLYAYIYIYVECLDLCVYLYVYTDFISVYINIYIHMFMCVKVRCIHIQAYLYVNMCVHICTSDYFLIHIWFDTW